MGVVRLIAVDLLPERLAVSRKMGATHTLCGSSIEVVETVRMMTGGLGVDLAVEAAGKGETLDLALKLVRRNGIVVAFGVPTRSHQPLALYDFFHNEGRLINSVGPNVQHDFPVAVEMIRSGAIDIEPLLTHRLPLRRAPEAFTLFADRAEGVIKVILTTDG
jgi:threonine dehydrogenase-like Zn-dependent dehydrogenase